MNENSPTQSGVHHVELNLRDVNQLFNTIDPSPFREKDLDRDAEEFMAADGNLPLRVVAIAPTLAGLWKNEPHEGGSSKARVIQATRRSSATQYLIPNDQTTPYQQAVEAVVALLDTDARRGSSEAGVRERLQR